MTYDPSYIGAGAGTGALIGGPVGAGIGAGIGALGGFFGGKKKRRPRYNPISELGAFDFNLDPNDPELALMRRDVLRSGERAKRGTVDEIYRAGLGGSSQSFDLLGERDRQTERGLSDVLGNVYGARRSEAHGDYASRLAHIRDLNRIGYGASVGAEYGDYNRAQESEYAGKEAIGELGGSLFQDWWRRRLLKGGDTDPYGGANWDSGGYTDWPQEPSSTGGYR